MSDTSPAPTPPQPQPQRDEPKRGLVPRFTEAPQTEPDLPPSPPAEEPTPAPDIKTRARRILNPLLGPDDPDTTRRTSPTATSTAGEIDRPPSKVTASDITGLMVGVLGLAVTIAGGVIRWQAKRRLREPTKQQRRDIAAPVGRILARRADLTLLGPDIGDLLEAAAATGAYIGDGPLLLPPDKIDPNVPDDLQEPPA